jgi:hypothetical protein
MLVDNIKTHKYQSVCGIVGRSLQAKARSETVKF